MTCRSEYCTVMEAVEYDALPENVRMLCDKVTAHRVEEAYDEGYSEGRAAGYEQGKARGLEEGMARGKGKK